MLVVVASVERQQRTSCQQVLEADVERGIRVGCEDCPLLAGNVLWPAVLVSYRITDLCTGANSCQHSSRTGQVSLSRGRTGAFGGS